MEFVPVFDMQELREDVEEAAKIEDPQFGLDRALDIALKASDPKVVEKAVLFFRLFGAAVLEDRRRAFCPPGLKEAVQIVFKTGKVPAFFSSAPLVRPRLLSGAISLGD